METIWIVKASSGQYDDAWQWNVIAFSTEEAAQDYIASQPQINYEVSRELQELQSKYCAVFYEQQQGTEDFTDEQWDQYYDEEEKLNQKALEEIQAKYPYADLSMDDDFNGYTIDSVVFGG